MKVCLRIALFCLVFSIFAPSVFAGSYQLSPKGAQFVEDRNIRYQYTLDTGQIVEDTLSIQRKMGRKDAYEVDLDLYVVDAYMTSNGFLGMSPEDQDQLHIGQWITYEVSDYNMLGSTSLEVPLTISIPENATPGQYIGGLILIEKKSDSESTDQSGSTIKLRYATAISINLEGELKPSYEVKNISYTIEDNILNLEFDFFNTGNVAYTLEGDFLLDGLYTSESVTIPSRTVLPGQNITISQQFSEMHKFFTYTDTTLDLSLSYSALDENSTESIQFSGSFFYVSILFICLLVPIFLVIYLMMYFLLRRFTK